MRSDWPRAGRCVSDNFAVPGTAVGAHRRGNDPARNTCSTDVNAPPQAIPSISLQRGILYFQMPIVHRLEHFSVDWPKERARRQYEQYGEREATQGKSLKIALSQRLFNFWHRIGQGAQKKCWTVRRMEMNNAAVQRCKFEFNQTVTASLRRRRGVHHRSAGLAWIQRVKHKCACLSLCIRRVRQHHAALEGAAIMHTRNHFLAWIAAFVEIHAADEFKIDHLRHKLRLCGRRNPGFSRL